MENQDGGYLVPRHIAILIRLGFMLRVTGHTNAIKTIAWFMYGVKP